jgi:hypothetical protein
MLKIPKIHIICDQVLNLSGRWPQKKHAAHFEENLNNQSLRFAIGKNKIGFRMRKNIEVIKYYIGQAIDLEKRIQEHNSAACQNSSHRWLR